MRCSRAVPLLVVVLALAFVSSAAHAALPAPVAQALSAAGIPDSAVGLYVHEIGTERAAVSHGRSARSIPRRP
jgi:hypothetical protein